jgi:hypothetical protein
MVPDNHLDVADHAELIRMLTRTLDTTFPFLAGNELQLIVERFNYAAVLDIWKVKSESLVHCSWRVQEPRDHSAVREGM